MNLTYEVLQSLRLKARDIDPFSEVLKEKPFGWIMIFSQDKVVCAYYENEYITPDRRVIKNNGRFDFYSIFNAFILHFDKIKAGNISTFQFWNLV